jgi:hypothetical protein
MNDSKRPTLAAMEAALSAYRRTPSVDPATDGLSDDVKLFWTILQKSDELQSTVMAFAAELVSDRDLDEFDLEHVQELMASGKLSDDLMFKIGVMCEQFFWFGWHARGAMDDSEALERMTSD